MKKGLKSLSLVDLHEHAQTLRIQMKIQFRFKEGSQAKRATM